MNIKNQGVPDVLIAKPSHRAVLSFLFKFKEGTFVEVSNETLISQPQAQGILRDLEIDQFDLIERIGKTIQGHNIFTLNAKGRAYAELHGIEPGNQNMGEIRASEAEKDVKNLQQRLVLTYQELIVAKNEIAELSESLKELKKLPPAPKPKKPGSIRFPEEQ